MNKKDTVGELGEAPNEKWKKFFNQFSEIETLEITQWKPVHLLSYFCKLYKNTFNVDYVFKFNNPSPSKSFEVFQIKKLGIQISSKPEILKEYIDWFYGGVIKNKKRFTSISATTKEDLVNEYKWNVLLVNKKQLHLTRSSELSVTYQATLAANGFKIKTYGDLAFLYHATQSQGLEINVSNKFNDTLKEMCAEGFDASVLDRIT